MMAKRNIFFLSVAIYAILFSIWAAFEYPVQISICELSGGADKCSTQYLPVGILHWALFQLDRYGVLITAIATGFIAWFTWNLKRSTDKLWEASQQQLIAERRAWVSVEDVKLLSPTKFTDEGFIFRVSATAKHHGETPATSVWIEFESYYSEENEVNFSDAERSFRRKLRSRPSVMGESLFKGGTFTTAELWSDGPEKIKPAIQTRPNGERKFGFTVFIGVSYRIVGDPNAHITQYAFGMLNVPIGTEIIDGREIPLPRMPFLAGQID